MPNKTQKLNDDKNDIKEQERYCQWLYSYRIFFLVNFGAIKRGNKSGCVGVAFRRTPDGFGIRPTKIRFFESDLK